jgi:hypothetical protein
MTEKETHATWFHAAYVVLERDLAQVQARLDELEATMSLLHTKMDILMGHMMAAEMQDPPPRRRPRASRAKPRS